MLTPTAADLCQISFEARLRAYTALALASAQASAVLEAAEQADTEPCPPPDFEPEPIILPGLRCPVIIVQDSAFPEDPDYA